MKNSDIGFRISNCRSRISDLGSGILEPQKTKSQQDDQKGHPARPEGAKPPERTSVREEASRRRTPLAVFLIILLAGCGPAGVTLLKPSDLVNYQYVTCYPHGDDPSVLKDCIQYYEARGFVKQDDINLLQM